MSNPKINIRNLLPEFYREDYALFIRFIELYYEWLYRSEGLSKPEIERLIADGSWMSVDVDKFAQTGDLRYMKTGDPRKDFLAIVQRSNNDAPGAVCDQLEREFDLEYDFDGFLTADGEAFGDSNDVALESRHLNKDMVAMWLATMGFDSSLSDPILAGFDSPLLVRTLKHLYDVKGTKKCIQMFFNIMYGEDVEVFYPKMEVASIDDNFVPDDDRSVLRDDFYFQEFSYVILADRDPAAYAPHFENVYLKHLHPSGFKCFLAKRR